MWLSAVGAAFLLASCGGAGLGNSETGFLPFKSAEGRNWGLISPDGKVLVDDKFERCPSAVVNGRFMVAEEGGCVLYAAGDKPVPVDGTVWRNVGDFTEEVAPAVEKGKSVVLIDRAGRVVSDVARLNGKSVVEVGPFRQGAAVYRTAEDYYGLVNTAGEVVADAQYVMLFLINGGKTVGVHRKYEEAYRLGANDKVKYTVLDTKGHVLGEIDGRGIEKVTANFAEGLVGAVVKQDGKVCAGLLDGQGKWVAGPFPEVSDIIEVRDGAFVFRNRDGKCGVMNLDGKVVMRARYDGLNFIADNVLAAYDADGDSDERCLLVSVTGERIGRTGFREILSCGLGNCGSCIVEVAEDEHRLVGLDGEFVVAEDGRDIYDIFPHDAFSSVENDRIDMEDLIAPLGITEEGLRGCKLGMDMAEAVRLSDSYDRLLNGSDTGLLPEVEDTARLTAMGYLTVTRDIPTIFDMKFSNHSGSVVLHSSDEICHYHQLAHEDGGDPAAARRPVICAVGASVGGTFTEKLAGRCREFYEAVAVKFRAMGKTLKDNGNALVVDIAGRQRFGVVLFSGSSVSFGIVAGNGQTFDITPFASASEEHPISEDFFTQVVEADCTEVGYP